MEKKRPAVRVHRRVVVVDLGYPPDPKLARCLGGLGFRRGHWLFPGRYECWLWEEPVKRAAQIGRLKRWAAKRGWSELLEALEGLQ